MDEATTIWEQARNTLVSNDELHDDFVHLLHTVYDLWQDANAYQFDNPSRLLSLNEVKEQAFILSHWIVDNRRIAIRLIDEFCYNTIGVWIGLSDRLYVKYLQEHNLEGLSEPGSARLLEQF